MTPAQAFRSRAFKYAAIAALPLIVFFWAPAVNVVILSCGERLLLRTMPVDPSDFLRGDYVTLDYIISDIPDEALADDLKAADDSGASIAGGTVYVTLTKDAAGIGSVKNASLARPPGELYLRGRLSRRWRGTATVDYGLGVYYVPEGTGRELEEAISESSVFADVRVLMGRGVIKKLEIKKQ